MSWTPGRLAGLFKTTTMVRLSKLESSVLVLGAATVIIATGTSLHLLKGLAE